MSQFSPAEKKAFGLISILFLAAFTLQWLKPHGFHPELYDYTLQDSLFHVLAADTMVEQENDPAGMEQAEDEVSQKKTRRSEPEQKLTAKSININTAGIESLKRLPRIGPVTAGNIIQYREQNGPFKSLEELDNVTRIGPKTLELIRPYIFIPDSL